MGILSGLEPGPVWTWFERICAIPHGSRHTDRLRSLLAEAARGWGLETILDDAGNLVIRKDGTLGLENAEPVILQGHLDMVCEKEAGCPLDFSQEGLRLRVADGFVSAQGTTLGGDDGIAVAYCMALLEDGEIPHPPLEVVLTTDEEIGMLGAAALDLSLLRGRRLVNLDSEEEGVFLAGCAGGVTVKCVLPVRRVAAPGTFLRIRIGGLTGGHSGTEIHRSRANGDHLLGRLLYKTRKESDFRLVWVRGGSKDNAIPRAAEAVLASASPENAEAVQRTVEKWGAVLKREYRDTDPGFSITVEDTKAPDLPPMDRDSTCRTITALFALPNGVLRMNRCLPEMVETSLNLGIVDTAESTVSLSFLVRSGVESEKQAVADRLACLTEALGGSVTYSGDYPGWAYRTDSPLRERFVQTFARLYGHRPEIRSIHAGLECGIFAGGLDGLDVLSLGPEILDIHTPSERMNVDSVRRTWELLLAALASME